MLKIEQERIEHKIAGYQKQLDGLQFKTGRVVDIMDGLEKERRAKMVEVENEEAREERERQKRRDELAANSSTESAGI